MLSTSIHSLVRSRQARSIP